MQSATRPPIARQALRLEWPRTFEHLVRRRLARSGVLVDDPRCAYAIQVRSPAFYRRAVVEGSLGLGESYADGAWECEALDEMFARLLRPDGDDPEDSAFGAFVDFRHALWSRPLNRQSRLRAARDVAAHYDQDEELFRAMLDRRLVYSCAYWEQARSLDEA